MGTFSWRRRVEKYVVKHSLVSCLRENKILTCALVSGKEEREEKGRWTTGRGKATARTYRKTIDITNYFKQTNTYEDLSSKRD